MAPNLLESKNEEENIRVVLREELSPASSFMKASHSVYDSKLRSSTTTTPAKSAMMGSEMKGSLADEPEPSARSTLSQLPMTDFPIFVLNRQYMSSLATILTTRLEDFF